MTMYSFTARDMCITSCGRTRLPTCLVEGTSNLTLRTATKRRHETLVAAARIHGGSENNPTPALDGMLNTSVVN